MKLVNCIITVPKGASVRLDPQDEYVNTRQVETTVAYMSSKDKDDKRVLRLLRALAGSFKFVSVMLLGISYRYKVCCVWAFARNQATISFGGRFALCPRCVAKKHRITLVKGVRTK